MKDLRNKTISGFIYKFLERCGAKGVGFVVSIVLARILLPEQFGIVSLVSIFITVCDVFVTYGFGNSLIAFQDSDDTDFSTCFYFGLALSAVVYALVYCIAPFFSNFYEIPEMTPVIRVMAIRIPIASINSVQHAYVSKRMMFKTFFYSTLIGTVITGVIAVYMAYKGLGVWSLVEQSLGNVCIDTICLGLFVKWRPKLLFSFQRLKRIYSYGWKVLVVGLIDTGFNQLRSLVIGKKYSSADLAYYDKGMQFPSFGMQIVEPTISGVIFPAIASCNDNIAVMKSITRRVIKTATFIIFPFMVGIIACSEDIIRVILTEKWLPSVPFLVVGCFAYMFRPIQVINNSVIRATGRSDILLKMDLLKKGFGIAVLVLSVPFGPIGIAIGFAVTNLFSTLVNIYPNKKLLLYGYVEQFLDVFKNLASSICMGIVVFFVSYLGFPPVLKLLIKVILGMMLYLGISVITKNDTYYYLLSLAKKYIRTKRKKTT